jgi:hypothetical protein
MERLSILLGTVAAAELLPLLLVVGHVHIAGAELVIPGEFHNDRGYDEPRKELENKVPGLYLGAYNAT